MSAEYSARVSDIMLEPCYVAADQLMSPPLVTELVRRHEIREIDVVFSSLTRLMNPMPSEYGTVLGKDCAKLR